MTTLAQTYSSVYQYPHYYALGYRWNTKAECDFLESCLKQSFSGKATRVLDIGCGSGRHMLELAKRGYQATGFDIRPEMVEFVNAEAKKAKVSVHASVGDLREMTVTGSFDLAICLMDTFRFLLANTEIIHHLQRVAQHLTPGGLYVTDFWVPMQWDKVADEIYQWEQTEGDTTVKVFYLQHPDTVDPVNQTFEDELVFVIEEGGVSKEIRGERTRTRLIMPQEFHALVQASGVFECMGSYADFDAEKLLEPSCLSWRMVSVLRKRA